VALGTSCLLCHALKLLHTHFLLAVYPLSVCVHRSSKRRSPPRSSCSCAILFLRLPSFLLHVILCMRFLATRRTICLFGCSPLLPPSDMSSRLGSGAQEQLRKRTSRLAAPSRSVCSFLAKPTIICIGSHLHTLAHAAEPTLRCTIRKMTSSATPRSKCLWWC
jgi:hypothetical protein